MGKPRYLMVIDIRRCIGCQACTVACKAENEVPLGVWRTHVRYLEKGKYPNVKRYFLPILCDHCIDPPCVGASETGAFYKREDGIVLIDYQKFEKERKYYTGAVIESCPLEQIFTNPMTGAPEKCTFCAHRVDKGVVPACVNTCIGRARVFGDFNDPSSEVSRIIANNPTQALHPDVDPDPAVLYIGLEHLQEFRIKGFRQINPRNFDTGELSMQAG